MFYGKLPVVNILSPLFSVAPVNIIHLASRRYFKVKNLVSGKYDRETMELLKNVVEANFAINRLYYLWLE